MRTARNGAIIMTTVMDSQFMEVNASLRVMPVLMISDMVELFFTQNKVLENQSKENYV